MTNPIFIISLPRSGSTLLQRILNSSSEIATAAEPWIALPFYSSVVSEGIIAEYSHAHYIRARRDLEKIVDIRLHVKNALQGIYNDLSCGNRFFVDKTPRYTLIVDKLIEDFENAKFIFLWRDPIAVVSSICETWFGGRWKPHHFNVDLYKGFMNAINTFKRNKDNKNVLSIRYEDLVGGAGIERLENFLSINLNVERAVRTSISGTMGDPIGQFRFKTIQNGRIDSWRNTVSSSLRKKWCKKYLDFIGENNLKVIGYSKTDLAGQIDTVKSRVNLLDYVDIFLGEVHGAISPEFNIKRFKKFLKGEQCFDYR